MASRSGNPEFVLLRTYDSGNSEEMAKAGSLEELGEILELKTGGLINGTQRETEK